MIAHLNSLIDTLALDHLRGAAEIVSDLFHLFADITVEGEKNSPSAEQLFDRAVRRLARGQPAMAPVLNTLNSICHTFEAAGGDWQVFREDLENLHREFSSHRELMIKRASEIPNVRGTLLTFSNSSTVARMIIACYENGWLNDVICGEGRPLCEGLVMARKLTTAGVPVKLFTDAAIMSNIVKADSVWIGGDALSHKGLVNKTGSLALAMLSKIMEIQFISLMSSSKLLSPELFPYYSFLPQNPREIAADEAEDINIVNEYYENIPLELVTHVFTEEGLFSPNVVLQNTEFDQVSRLFKDLVGNSG